MHYICDKFSVSNNLLYYLLERLARENVNLSYFFLPTVNKDAGKIKEQKRILFRMQSLNSL